VERREGAEGNTIKHRTRRTQSRVSVYLGLERARNRARTEKKERFTALLHHVDVDSASDSVFLAQAGCLSFEYVESAIARPRESRDRAEIEPKLHELLSGAHAVTGIAAEASSQVRPPKAAYQCSGASTSEARRAQ